MGVSRSKKVASSRRTCWMKCSGDMPTTEAVVRCSVRSLIPRSRAAADMRMGSESRCRTHLSNAAIVGSVRASKAGMANAACDGRSPVSKYRAVRSAKLGLCCCTIDSARSIWANAAPAVVIRASRAMIRVSSTCTAGYRLRNAGPSHQLVVASRPSRTPDSAKKKVPVQAPASSVPFAWLSRMRSRAACPRTVSMIS